MPYLVKNKFVCYDKPSLHFKVPSQDGNQDEVLSGFFRTGDKIKMSRIKRTEAINNPNPLNDIPKIEICNSFQLNKKAMSNTIHTLLQGDTQSIAKPDDISDVVAQRLRGHFSIGDNYSEMNNDESYSPYDNYQMNRSV